MNGQFASTRRHGQGPATRRWMIIRWGALTLLLTAYTVLALSPFQWRVPGIRANPVEIINGGGFRFFGPAVARTRQSPVWLNAVIDGAPLKIQMRVAPDRVDQRGPARILTISKNTSLRNLTIGQEGTDLILRLRTVKSSLNGLPPVKMENVFQAGVPVEISLFARPGLLRLEAGGRQIERKLSSRPFGVWDPSYRLALADELTGDRPWVGVIHETVARVGSMTVDYLEPNALRIPQRLINFHKKPVTRPFVDVGPVDGFVNFVGYLPLGLLLAWILRPRQGATILYSILIALVVSGSLELAQVFLPVRTPSIGDWILNTTGAAVGSILYLLASSKYKRGSA